ncbi:DUF3349 domain-containing protein [Mycobacterium sp. Marseille-P9652]|uniref:DUF3349 domain-containing protein n=1 Tax=Mycobacterium sp. Marseille-P9652 TaxID=2654950 RepID=UPI0012E98B9F|nr:DUF3349 domain-containing protein [Mycobacterium sp. Marseille-P9652]
MGNGAAGWLAGAVAFLRAGYPSGAPAVGHAPLLALLPRRVSEDELTTVAAAVRTPERRETHPVDVRADIAVAITRLTHEMPSLDDIDRVRERLAAESGSG